MMMEMFGGVFVMMLFAYSLVPLFPFVYVLLRWRQAREGGAPDPQLGLKVAVYYFMTIGLHVVLMALALGLYGLIVDRAPESMMRAAAGLLLGGGIVYGLHRAILSRVVDAARRANVARVFAVLNVVLCGLIGMGGDPQTCLTECMVDPFTNPVLLAAYMCVMANCGGDCGL